MRAELNEKKRKTNEKVERQKKHSFDVFSACSLWFVMYTNGSVRWYIKTYIYIQVHMAYKQTGQTNMNKIKVNT